MKQNAIHITILLAILSVFACEKNITVDLPKVERKMVIEGEINTNFPAIVLLSYNMDYFATIDSNALANTFITDNNAIVVVSDGEAFDTLSIQPITKFPFQAFVGRRILGEEGKTYTLEVTYKDKSYHSSTSIPERAPISDIWFKPNIDNDSVGMINFSFFDEGSTNNYYYVTSLHIGQQLWYYKPAFGVPVFDDIFFNGDSMIVQLAKGYTGNDFSQPGFDGDKERDSILYFAPGESVSLRLSTMNQDFYLWWNSLVRSDFTGSNPYANPSAILTNIEGDPALGVWGGYANTIANIHISDSGTVEDISIQDILPMVLPDSIMAIIEAFIDQE